MKTATFSLVISITIAIFSLFQFGKYQKFSYSSLEHTQKLEQRVTTQFDAIQTEIAKLQQKTQENTNTISARHQNSVISLAETESLIFLANIRLQAARDVKTALILLKTAEEKIQLMQTPHLLPLQQSLRQDIQALQAVVVANTEDLWMNINTIIEQTAALSPRTLSLGLQTAVHEPKTPPESLSWKQSLLKSVSSMKDLISIRHYSKPIEPILSERQEELVKENLRALLEQARLAVLTQEEKIYQEALKNSVKWLETYYDESNQVVKNAHVALQTLQASHLQMQLPIITSLEQFKTLR